MRNRLALIRTVPATCGAVLAFGFAVPFSPAVAAAGGPVTVSSCTFSALARALALSSTTMQPGKHRLVLHSCTSTVSPRLRAAARREGGAFPGQDLLRSAPVAESCVEALGGPGLTVVQQRPGGREAALAGDNTPQSRSEDTERGSYAVDGQLVLILDALLSLPGQLGHVERSALDYR